MIKLNDYNFDEDYTTVTEKLREVGGSDSREFRISGLVVGKTTLSEIEAELDQILEEASKGDSQVFLQLRVGRGFNCERDRFERGVLEQERIGCFVLWLLARDPHEYSESENTGQWVVTESGAQKQLSASGNVFSLPVLEITAGGTLVEPCVSDGERSMKYVGQMVEGDELVINCAERSVVLNGEEVLPYTEGEFLRLEPGGTTFVYADGEGSSHSCTIDIKWYDRWW